jgi:hypothetical protein
MFTEAVFAACPAKVFGFLLASFTPASLRPTPELFETIARDRSASHTLGSVSTERAMRAFRPRL